MNLKFFKCPYAATALVAVLSAWVPTARAGWIVTDLAPFAQDRYSSSIAYGINASGQVVGESTGPGSTRSGITWINGAVGGVVGGTGGPYSSATAINTSGAMTGKFYLGYDTPKVHGFFQGSDGRSTDLGTFGGLRSAGYGINASGQVVGEANLVGDRSAHAFIWGAGVMKDLGTLGGASSAAYGINSTGQVTGYSENLTSITRAFVWDDKSGMRDLGTLGGDSSYSTGINELGQIVGGAQLDLNRTSHAFIWDSGSGMRDLGTLGGEWSVAYGINATGQIVGASSTGKGTVHPFFYSAGVMTDINDFVVGFSYVDYSHLAINDAGQIVGSGTIVGGREHGFLLTPTSVPEPASVALFGIGLISLSLSAGVRKSKNGF